MERKTGWNDYTERLDLYHSTKKSRKKSNSGPELERAPYGKLQLERGTS